MSAIAVDNSGAEACHSLAFVPARGKDEAVGIYTAECLRTRPGYLIKNVQCAPCPRGEPRPARAASTQEGS